MADTEFLDNERKKIWARLIELENDIKKKTSDYESEAKQASKKCAEFRNKCEVTKNEAEVFLKKVQSASDEITKSNVSSLISDIQSFHTELAPKKDAIDTQVAKLEELFESYELYAEQLEKLDGISTSAEDTSVKIEAIFTQLAARKKEVDQLYFEVFGYTKTDETTGKETKVLGLKNELDIAYKALKSDFEQFSKDKKTEFDDTLIQWEKSYSSSLKKINDLLPNALTAGLSHAYSDKKDKEIKERDALNTAFYWWIAGLILISLIPFGVSVYYMLTRGVSLEQTILRMPNLVFSILPLYVPPLWVALSINRKMNLSKRLIEEYTHKEVVSKTFEGLSTQIEGIKDSKVSNELKTKLLSNILEISTENPGKLISDYNKTDHPILEKIPVISKIFSRADTNTTKSEV